MPELPEVETVRGGLEKLIVGKKILSVECLCEKSLPVSPAEVRQISIGATVTAVRRRAKMLIIDLTGSYSLLVHLKMTGQMVYRGEANWGGGHPNDSFLNNLPDRSTRVIFHLSGDNQQVIPILQFLILRQYVFMFLLDVPFDVAQRLRVGKEV